jgi:hypothetical protein
MDVALDVFNVDLESDREIREFHWVGGGVVATRGCLAD